MTMTLQDLYDFQMKRITIPEIQETNIAINVLSSYLAQQPPHKLPYQFQGKPIEDLLKNYFILKGTPDGKLLENIMRRYNFNYSSSICNALHYLLCRPEDLMHHESYKSWPGVVSCQEQNNFYTLKSKIGTIKFYKASELFKNSHLSYIFDKKLSGYCYARTYEVLTEMPDETKAVISLMPNFFYGGYYHVYAKINGGILDIASNCFYENIKDSRKILNGEIIKEVTLHDIEEDYWHLSKKIPQIGPACNFDKLNALSIYYDYQNHHR